MPRRSRTTAIRGVAAPALLIAAIIDEAAVPNFSSRGMHAHATKLQLKVKLSRKSKLRMIARKK